MKIYKRFLGAFLSFALLTAFIGANQSTVYAECAELVEQGTVKEEKVACDATLEDDFADDSVLVVMNNEASLKFQKYGMKDFAEIACVKVDDLTTSMGEMRKDILDNSEISLISSVSDRYKVETYNQVLRIELKEKGKSNVLDAIQALQERDDVIYAGPDYLLTTCSTIPNDKEYKEQSYVANSIKLPQAWDICTGTSYARVGIIDSGIDGTHEDLKSNIVKRFCADFTSGKTVITTAPGDLTGHGTQMAGIIGAVGNNDLGVSGVCWKVSMVSLKILYYDTDMRENFGRASFVAEAINFAETNNISILNCSLGWNAGNSGYDFALESVMENYSGLIVCAAGNDYGVNNDSVGFYPCCFRLPNLISVGACYNNGEITDFSNYGKTTVDIFAPGYRVYTTYRHNDYYIGSGTSHATALVTGVAALLKSYNHSLSASELKSIILHSADPVDSLSDYCVTGGKINAYKAISMVNTGYTHSLSGYKSYFSLDNHKCICSICGVYDYQPHTWVKKSSNVSPQPTSTTVVPYSYIWFECTKCKNISITPPPNYINMLDNRLVLYYVIPECKKVCLNDYILEKED